MSLSDCPECWETPCCCGHNYQNWSTERIQGQIEMLQAVLDKRSATIQSLLNKRPAAFTPDAGPRANLFTDLIAPTLRYGKRTK